MKTNFVQRTNDIALEARKFIKDNVINGKRFDFHKLSLGEISEEEFDLLAELPQANYLREIEGILYRKIPILSVFKESGNILISVFEEEIREKTDLFFEEDDVIDDITACWIADLVSNQLWCMGYKSASPFLPQLLNINKTESEINLKKKVRAVIKKHKDKLDTMKENRSRWEEENWTDAKMQECDRMITTLAGVLSDLNKSLN